MSLSRFKQLTQTKSVQNVALSFALMANASGAFAVKEPMVLCDYCQGQSYTSAAIDAVNHGPVYVINRPGDTVKKFKVIREYEPGYEFVRAIQVSPDANDLNDIQAGLDLYASLSGSRVVNERQFDFPSGVNPDSALDMVSNPNWRYNTEMVVSNWAEDQTGSIGLNFAGDVLNLVGQDIKGEITIVFADGSTYTFTYEYSGVDQNGDLRLVYSAASGSGVGPNGQRIPETAGQMVGITVTGSAADIQNWIAVARQLGIPVVDGGGGIPQSMTCDQESCTVTAKPE